MDLYIQIISWLVAIIGGIAIVGLLTAFVVDLYSKHLWQSIRMTYKLECCQYYLQLAHKKGRTVKIEDEG